MTKHKEMIDFLSNYLDELTSAIQYVDQELSKEAAKDKNNKKGEKIVDFSKDPIYKSLLERIREKSVFAIDGKTHPSFLEEGREIFIGSRAEALQSALKKEYERIVQYIPLKMMDLNQTFEWQLRIIETASKAKERSDKEFENAISHLRS